MMKGIVSNDQGQIVFCVDISLERIDFRKGARDRSL
jgi:hypothetical protein